MVYYEQIYHVWEGYLQKIQVERRKKIPESIGKGNLVSRLVFLANTPPNMTYLFHRILFRTLAK